MGHLDTGRGAGFRRRPGYRERSRVGKGIWRKGEQQGLDGYLDTGGGAGLRSASGYMGRTRIEKEPWGTEKKEQG